MVGRRVLKSCRAFLLCSDCSVFNGACGEVGEGRQLCERGGAVGGGGVVESYPDERLATRTRLGRFWD